MYDCLIGSGELGQKRMQLTNDQLIALMEKATYFELIVSSMPLAQTPKGNLLLLLKTHDNEASLADVWVRVSLKPHPAAELVHQLLETLV